MFFSIGVDCFSHLKCFQVNIFMNNRNKGLETIITSETLYKQIKLFKETKKLVKSYDKKVFKEKNIGIKRQKHAKEKDFKSLNAKQKEA